MVNRATVWQEKQTNPNRFIFFGKSYGAKLWREASPSLLEESMGFTGNISIPPITIVSVKRFVILHPSWQLFIVTNSRCHIKFANSILMFNIGVHTFSKSKIKRSSLSTGAWRCFYLVKMYRLPPNKESRGRQPNWVGGIKSCFLPTTQRGQLWNDEYSPHLPLSLLFL